MFCQINKNITVVCNTIIVGVIQGTMNFVKSITDAKS